MIMLADEPLAWPPRVRKLWRGSGTLTDPFGSVEAEDAATDRFLTNPLLQ